MGQAEFEEVGGLLADALMEENKLELLGTESGGTSDTGAEHVYIVFSEEISIENGIEIIKQQVLSGAEPDIRRIDDAGHAAVLVVTTSQRQQIETLDEVVKVKINEAADVLKKNSEPRFSDTTGSEVTEESDTDSAAAEALVAEADKQEIAEEEIPASEISALAPEKEDTATEHIVKEETAQETYDEAVTGAQTMATVVESGVSVNEGQGGSSVGIIFAIVAAVCIVIAAAVVFIRKKR